MSIQLTPIVQPTVARTQVTAEQVASLITAIASANPAVLTLPEGKAYADVSRFMLIVRPDGAGMLDVVF
jgi:hypothetical protein